MKTPVLVAWALAATAAAVFLALRPAPETSRPRGGGVRPAHMGATIEALLSTAVPMPEKAAEGADPEELLARLDEFRKLGDERRRQPEYGKLRRTLFGLVAWNLESHLEFMEQLRTAEDADEVDEMLEFLVWNPWVGRVTKADVTDRVHRTAREILTKDPDVHRRAASARILSRYGRFDRANFDFLMDRLGADPDAGVRAVILEELVVAGRSVPLTRAEAEPLVAHMRRLMEEGDGWMASSIADWSEDPEDFRRLRERLEVERDPYERQGLLNAFRGECVLTRGRVDEARAVLIGVLENRTEDGDVRMLARDFLATSFGPMDAKSAAAVARYDREHKAK